MRVAGIDLAAKEDNITGLCIIEGKRIITDSKKSDENILSFIFSNNPDLVAIDAPLTLSTTRYAEKYLKRYGAMSLRIPWIRRLAIRGMRIAENIKEHKIKVIEVFPTATAKILEFYQKPKKDMVEYFKNQGFTFENDVKNEHEVDALIAAYTALLYLENKTESIDGVIIPKKLLK